MEVEPDHVFICVDRRAPEAEQSCCVWPLRRTSHVHPGQGTANRRFFFRNAMLEFAPAGKNSLGARSEVTAPMQLWERWSGRESGACPFGILVRSSNNDTARAPFPAQEYRPPVWLPRDVRIYVPRDPESSCHCPSHKATVDQFTLPRYLSSHASTARDRSGRSWLTSCGVSSTMWRLSPAGVPSIRNIGS